MGINQQQNNPPPTEQISPDDANYSSDGPVTMGEWCTKNGYSGVTSECVLSAFNSNDPKIQKLAKREKLKGMLNGLST